MYKYALHMYINEEEEMKRLVELRRREKVDRQARERMRANRC